MFYTGWTIFAAWMLALLPILIVDWANRRDMFGLSQCMLATMLASSLYLLSTGIDLAMDWPDPMSQVDASGVASAANDPRPWIVLLAMKVWSLVLTGFGALWAFGAAQILNCQRSRRA
jgi:hypothetical protein